MYYILWAFNFVSLILYMTWCIKSYMESPSHDFLASRWFIHNQFMNLDNLFEVVIHYLLIGKMTSLNYCDEIPIMSVLMYMIIY